jgi:branched-subunit amino acid ABC-type transport system permease component
VGDLVDYVIRGIPIGCVFALLAVGLVLTYRTSGVFNLAFAAQAYVSAAVFYVVRKEHEWPLVPAALLAIAVVAPLLGLLLERAFFRHLRSAPQLARTVTSLGLLVAIPEVIQLWLGNSGPQKNPPPLWWVERTDQWYWHVVGDYSLDAGQVVTMIAAALVAVALTIVLRFSSLGLKMRAVVESPRMAQLSGVDADRVSMTAWALSSAIAGLTGVLLAPLFEAVHPLHFFTLLAAALAACVMGRLVSIPWAFAGGIGLGVLQAVLAGYLPPSSVLSAGLRPALPFVVLFGLLLVRPPRLGEKTVSDPLVGVDPPPPPPPSAASVEGATTGYLVVAAAAALGGLAYAYWVLDSFWLELVIRGLILAVILASFTVLTGMGGMVSLCQATFAGIGAFATARIVDVTGMPVLVAVLIGVAVAAATGAVLAVPLLRLDGIYLTLATLAFALMFENVLMPLDWVSGGVVGPRVPRPLVAGVDLADNRSFLLFTALCVALVGGVVRLVRHGTTGRFLHALRGSESAAVAVGINPVRQRIVAFALAAGIAGFGGGLMATFRGSVNYDENFRFLLGLVWVVVVVTVGARTVRAAVVAGISFTLMPELLERAPLIPDRWSLGLASALFGLGALTYVRHPEGILDHQMSTLWRLLRRGRDGDDDAPAGAAHEREPATSTTATSTAFHVSATT